MLAATDYVTPALEILDTRIFRVDPETGKTRSVLDTISDNAANAGIVLGRGRIAPRETDLKWIGAICAKNDEIEETGLAAGVLGHPANGIVWLAARLSEHGRRSRRARSYSPARSSGRSRSPVGKNRRRLRIARFTIDRICLKRRDIG